MPPTRQQAAQDAALCQRLARGRLPHAAEVLVQVGYLQL